MIVFIVGCPCLLKSWKWSPRVFAKRWLSHELIILINCFQFHCNVLSIVMLFSKGCAHVGRGWGLGMCFFMRIVITEDGQRLSCELPLLYCGLQFSSSSWGQAQSRRRAVHVLLSDSTASARHSISSKLSDRVRQSIIIILNTHHHNHNYQCCSGSSNIIKVFNWELQQSIA